MSFAWLLDVWRFLTSSELGTLTSLFSTIATIWVLVNVRAIRTHFLFTARVPQLLEDLQQNASTISKALSDFDGSTDLLDVEIARCHANLKNLVPKVGRHTKKTAQRLIDKAEIYQSLPPNKDRARQIYTQLNGLMQELHNLREDTKWSDPNVG